MSEDHQSTGDGAEPREYGGPISEPLVAAGALAAPLMSAVNGTINDVYRTTEFARLSMDQEMRGDPPVSETVYPAHSHEELHSMVNEGLDTDTATSAGEVANEIGNWLKDVASTAHNAVQQEQVQWQGQAADKAHALFSANADWAESSSQAAYLSSNRYAEQAEAAGTARSQMPPPTHFDKQAEMDKVMQQVSSGDLAGAVKSYAQIEEKQAEADKQHAEAVRVMRNMDSAYHQTASTQPAFATPPDPADSSNGGTHTAQYVPPGTPGGGNASLPTGDGAGTGSTGAAPSSGAAAGPSYSGAPSASGRSFSGAAPGSSTTGGGYGGSTGAPSTGSTGGSYRPGYGAAAAGPVGGGLRGLGSETERTGRGSGGGSGGARGARGARAGGTAAPRSGSSSAAPRATSGNTSENPQRPAAGRSTAATPGSKAPVARGGAAAARAAESTGTAGRPIGAAPAGRGGQGGDDEEHERKYEFGDDPKEIFGDEAHYTEDGERVVPPVIGE